VVALPEPMAMGAHLGRYRRLTLADSVARFLARPARGVGRGPHLNGVTSVHPKGCTPIGVQNSYDRLQAHCPYRKPKTADERLRIG
jgi:hypothetical protein